MKMKIDTAEQNFLNGISMIEDFENILDDLDFPMEAEVGEDWEDWNATVYGPLFGPIPDDLLSLRQNCLDDDMTRNEFPEAQRNALLETQSPISLDIGSKGRRSKRTRPSTLNPWLLMDPIPCADKKHSDAKRGTENVSGPMGSSLFKRFTHCEVTKTPQWREGPLGPKTLCNACGVRYRSGRLLPEYRPAASPTFIPSLHSNSHRKVVEMRTKFAPLHSYLFNGYC